MLEAGYLKYLLKDPNIISKDKAVSSRMSRAKMVEKTLGVSLDLIVADDDRMHSALLKINQVMNNKNGNYSNALRKYYAFKNGREFPRLDDYRK